MLSREHLCLLEHPSNQCLQLNMATWFKCLKKKKKLKGEKKISLETEWDSFAPSW